MPFLNSDSPGTFPGCFSVFSVTQTKRMFLAGSTEEIKREFLAWLKFLGQFFSWLAHKTPEGVSFGRKIVLKIARSMNAVSHTYIQETNQAIYAFPTDL